MFARKLKAAGQIAAFSVPCLLIGGCAAIGSPYKASSPQRASITLDLEAPERIYGNMLYHPPGAMSEGACSATDVQAIGVLRNKSNINRYADHGKFVESMNFDVDATGRPFRILGLSNKIDMGNTPLVAPIGGGGIFIAMPVDVAICQPNVEFVPIPGEHYRARFVAHTKGMCEISILTDEGAPAPGYKKLPDCYIRNGQSLDYIHFVKEQMQSNPKPYEDAALEVY
jgi:hypothetical protein